MNLLVTQDQSVERFLIRNADNRFSERESKGVAEWMTSDYDFHCFRDYSGISVIPGIYGAVREKLLSSLDDIKVLDLLSAIHTQNSKWFSSVHVNPTRDVEEILREKMKKSILYQSSSKCHDSSSPKKDGEEYFIGEKFNGFGEVADAELHKRISNCL